MSSTITNYTSNINTAFPVPGADNDTQGFRDNFGAIQNALDVAAAEISDLQIINTAIATYTITKPAFSHGTDGDRTGMVHANSTTIYICYGDYVNTTTNIWAKVSTDSNTW
jgi:hypothetical protein